MDGTEGWLWWVEAPHSPICQMVLQASKKIRFLPAVCAPPWLSEEVNKSFRQGVLQGWSDEPQAFSDEANDLTPGRRAGLERGASGVSW